MQSTHQRVMKKVKVRDPDGEAKIPHDPKYDRRDGQGREVSAVSDRLHSRAKCSETLSLLCALREGTVKLVRAEGLEPSRTLRSNGFSYPSTAFAAPAILAAGFGVWTIPSPCPDLAPGLGAARLVSTPSQPFRAKLGSGSPFYRGPRI